MPVSQFFPVSNREEGGYITPEGFLANRLTGTALITATPSGNSGLALLDSNGAALQLPANSIVHDIKFRYYNLAGNPLILATAGVIKVATTANADANSTSVPAAVGRNAAGTALSTATSFPADTFGHSAIPLQTPVANATAGALFVFARDAVAAGTNSFNMSCADGRGLIMVELFASTRLAPSRFDAFTLSDALLATLTPTMG